MADIFCDFASGDDADDGSTRALAKKTLAAALTAAGAGGRVGVKNDHAESQASAMSLTSPGTAASPTQILTIDWSSDTFGSNALATGATVTTTGNSAISLAGFAYMYGVTLIRSGSDAAFIRWVSASPWWWRIESGGLTLGSSSSSRIEVGENLTSVDDQLLELHNCVLTFGHASQTVVVRCPIIWTGSSSSVGGTIPTILLTPQAAFQEQILVRGVDLSALDTGKSLTSIAAASSAKVTFENCKLGSSVSIATGTVPGQGGMEVAAVNCDSADTNYRYFRQTYKGTITHESTIVRTGGASDGTTAISRKMVSTANSKFYSPLVSDPIIVWNETTGSSKTVTVEVITDGVTLTDAEAWVEVEYLGTSGFPLSSFAHDRASTILSTPANQASSSETWTTTGLGSPTKQALAVSFTPQEKGPFAIRVHLAKASTTMYFCPKATVA